MAVSQGFPVFLFSARQCDEASRNYEQLRRRRLRGAFLDVTIITSGVSPFNRLISHVGSTSTRLRKPLDYVWMLLCSRCRSMFGVSSLSTMDLCDESCSDRYPCEGQNRGLPAKEAKPSIFRHYLGIGQGPKRAVAMGAIELLCASSSCAHWIVSTQGVEIVMLV